MRGFVANTTVSGVRIGIVTARFNSEITDRLFDGAIEALKANGITDSEIVSVSVPGAFEIPFAAQELLEAGVDGVVALGCIIRGETTHYDFVCNSVERGCTELNLKYRKPVSFGVLTTEDSIQARDRAGGRYGNKGKEAAKVTLEMINLKQTLINPTPNKESNVHV